MTITQEQPSATRATRTGIIDCDVHPMPRGVDEIRSYMPMPWRDRYSGGGRGFMNNPIHGARLDSKPPDGPIGSDPAFLHQQLIDLYGIEGAILLPRAFCNQHPDPDFGTAIAAAFNDWLADTGSRSTIAMACSKARSPSRTRVLWLRRARSSAIRGSIQNA